MTKRKRRETKAKPTEHQPQDQRHEHQKKQKQLEKEEQHSRRCRLPACKSYIAADKRPMRSVSTSTHTLSQMKRIFTRDGFICVRQLVPTSAVTKARNFVLDALRHDGFVDPASRDTISSNNNNDSVTVTSPNLLRRRDIAFSPAVAGATMHLNIVELIAVLLEDTSTNNDDSNNAMVSQFPPPNPDFPAVSQVPHAWLRAVGHGQSTGPHVDRVYLGAGSQNVLTVWMPLTRVDIARGALCVAPTSHTGSAFARLRDEYGSVPAGKDGTVSGWVTEFPHCIASKYGIKVSGGLDDDDSNDDESICESGYECGVKNEEDLENISENNYEEDSTEHDNSEIRWVTRNFELGDVVIFGLDLLHLTLNNTTDKWRISCETRWQPTGDPYPPFFHSANPSNV
ncbi:hypothetical protein HK100_004601 [Physocladia obscura]|uniref:Uncharacterized protein n=1 Tax=Physocladia obscura TaxID=109957 RepID=A0AAD5SUV3_9FUNG|nr:hypothetical protein HK100_004601 [Physocladia obscura]